MKRGRRSGFTLVEMVVATVLLALGVVGALACISSATRSTSISSEYTTASLLAQQKLAELEAQPDQIQGGEQSGDFGEDHPTFSWRQQLDSTPIASLMRVTLNIDWKSGSIARSAQFASYVLLPEDEQP